MHRSPDSRDKKSVPESRSLAAEFPSLVPEWHPAKNGELTAADVRPASHRKVWWRCEKGHEWQAQINARTYGSACPVCANKIVLSGVNDLATVRPDIAAQWHPTRNEGRVPQEFVRGSRAKVWWQCEKGHEWQATIFSRSSGGAACPVCAGKRVVPGENDLASMYPAVATQWHPDKNGTLTPHSVTPFSNRKVWWRCGRGHEYMATVGHRTQSDSDCPYCKNRKVLSGFNDLATSEPKIAAEWHPTLNGGLTPERVTAGSRKKIWWQCAEGHVWQAMVFSRTGPQKCGCPVCAGRVSEHKKLRYIAIAAK